MTPDELYGDGFIGRFSDALPGDPDVEVYGDRVNVTWTDGSLMKIDCTADRVRFLHLKSERDGLYSDLCETLPALFRDVGVQKFIAEPANEESRSVLRKRGSWGKSGSLLIWEL